MNKEILLADGYWCFKQSRNHRVCLCVLASMSPHVRMDMNESSDLSKDGQMTHKHDLFQTPGGAENTASL
jgi:hypothetical protein